MLPIHHFHCIFKHSLFWSQKHDKSNFQQQLYMQFHFPSEILQLPFHKKIKTDKHIAWIFIIPYVIFVWIISRAQISGSAIWVFANVNLVESGAVHLFSRQEYADCIIFMWCTVINKTCINFGQNIQMPLSLLCALRRIKDCWPLFIFWQRACLIHQTVWDRRN